MSDRLERIRSPSSLAQARLLARQSAMGARADSLCSRGAKVLVVDRRLDSAEDTCAMIAKEGGEAIPFQADAIKGDDCKKVADACVQRFGPSIFSTTMSALVTTTAG